MPLVAAIDADFASITEALVFNTDILASDMQQEPETGQVQELPPLEPHPAMPEFEIYGFAMLDMGYGFGQIDPNWFDVERPTKLPAFRNEFGHNGNSFAGVRQTRFGVESIIPTQYGDLTTKFEWELFGVGVDAGQTTLRLRHAYGEL